MNEKRFCPYCGKELKQTAKFCGGCGNKVTREGMIQPSEPKEPTAQITSPKKESAINKEKINESLNQAKEGTEKVIGNIKETISSEDMKSRVDKSVNGLKNMSTKTKKIIMAVVLVIVLFGGWNWVSNKDYRAAMQNGETYFERGEYGDAQEFYKTAQELKPGDKKALEMYDYSTELGDIWIQINSGSFVDSTVSTYEYVVSKVDDVKKGTVKQAYEQAAENIKNTSSYQIEERIEKKYSDLYED